MSESQWGRGAKQRTFQSRAKQKSHQAGKILPESEAAQGKPCALLCSSAALSPRTLPASAGFLPRFWGCSSPLCSCSAGEQKTNGLICAKSRLQLGRFLCLLSSQYFPALQIRMNARLSLKSCSVYRAQGSRWVAPLSAFLKVF